MVIPRKSVPNDKWCKSRTNDLFVFEGQSFGWKLGLLMKKAEGSVFAIESDVSSEVSADPSLSSVPASSDVSSGESDDPSLSSVTASSELITINDSYGRRSSMRMRSNSGSYSDRDDLRSFCYVAMRLQNKIKETAKVLGQNKEDMKTSSEFASSMIPPCTGSSVFDDIAGIIASATDGRLIQVELSTHLNSLTSPIAEFDNSINTYPTSKLWLQYIRMVLIMLQCLLADRCGNWDLHLKAIRMMPPFMASTGHNKYAIYLTMYLQDMERVPEQLREQLLQGHITVERSVGSDNAVSPDHALESSLNLEAKQKGGIKGLTLNGTAVAK
ncbi:hypothetical protein QYM36_005094 [Artemia franciscana]|uniref:Uncharacterized protein n=1 Tax=Artemia franciscana TaxID=6661 RepID=A0AA88IEQ3_ARTSF|nr:hypothetical protein QYM36_005094 [Artemia franciscana]